MKMNRFVVSLLCVPAVVGCLKTRAQLAAENPQAPRAEQRQILIAQRQQQQQRQAPPPPTPQYQEDTFEQLRNLSGRIDVVENQLTQINASNAGEKDAVAKTKKELDQKFVAYEEALKKLELQVQTLSEDLSKMREEMAAAAAATAPTKDKKNDKNKKNKNSAAYEEGEALIAQKKWREAIISFEEYRKANPKGKHYADATYKIGVCMQEVGMRAEAKLFYDEVIAKFPGSKEAKKAAYRLKTIK